MSIEIAHLGRNGNLIPRTPSESPDPLPWLNLRQIIYILRRRIALIVTVMLLGMGLSAMLAYTLPVTYQATAQIVLVRNDTRPYDPLGREERDRSAVETEIDLLESRALAARIVDALGLVADPRFNPFLPSQPPTNVLSRALADLRAATDAAVRSLLYALSLPPPTRPPPPSPSVQHDAAITSLVSSLKAKRTGESLVVDISITSNSPEFAQILANTTANEYVRYSLELKQDPSVDAATLAQAQAAQSLLSSLRAEEARLERERAILASRYGKNHPRMLDAESAVASARRLVRVELDRINSEVVTASNKPGARIMSLAALPTKPSSPAPSLIMAGGMIGSLLVAAIWAMLRESGDTRIRTGRRLSELAGVRDFGELPEIPRRFGFLRQDPRDYILARPLSRFANAVGLAYARCFLTRSQRAPQIVTITSSLPGEGASSLAAALAATAIADGRRTALIDFNNAYAWQKGAGAGMEKETLLMSPLGERSYVADASSHNAAMQSFEAAAVGVVSALSTPSMTSGKWQELGAELRQRFDVIVIDAPAVLAVKDVAQLAPVSDAVILVALWGRTREETIAEAICSLHAVNAPLFGTILNRVDAHVNVKHGHGGVRLPRGVARRYMKG